MLRGLSVFAPATTTGISWSDWLNTAPTYYPWGNSCDADDNCPPGVSAKRHQWSALFDQETARRLDLDAASRHCR